MKQPVSHCVKIFFCPRRKENVIKISSSPLDEIASQTVDILSSMDNNILIRKFARYHPGAKSFSLLDDDIVIKTLDETNMANFSFTSFIN